VETLRAFLDHFGDSTAAAASLDVHPNTFRYRMRRLLEISGLDLDDPVERMVVYLQLRIRDSQP
jgi:DNA-binding PucR family transcriptional regulator